MGFWNLRGSNGVARWAIFLWIFVIAVAIVVLPGVPERLTFVVNSERSDALKVLFIGNSFTYSNDMPTMLFRILQAGLAQRPLKIGQVTYPSLPLALQWHYGVAPEAIRKSGPWDFVIIQEQSVGPIRAPDDFAHYGSLFDAEIRKAGARTVLLMTWADLDRNEDQKILTQRYEELGRKLQCLVAPAGTALFRAHNRFPKLSLYQADHHHPGPMGSYLVACTIYGVLTKSNPSQLPATVTVLKDQNNHTLVTMTNEEARQIQSTVWQTISDPQPIVNYH